MHFEYRTFFAPRDIRSNSVLNVGSPVRDFIIGKEFLQTCESPVLSFSEVNLTQTCESPVLSFSEVDLTQTCESPVQKTMPTFQELCKNS